MPEYKCGNCGDVVEEPRDSSGSIQCPKCRHKIFFKVRQSVARTVKAE